MTEDEVRAYYDIPENAEYMCGLLARAHPGWQVRQLGSDRTFRSVPVWCARHESWPASHQSLIDENAGLLNLAMTMVDESAVA
ncbi:hypothetical protein ABZ912_05405 [Nonomuraea angiospora]|uniref:hypothetical protein n=1 Tax=Nonomuraea angiospora TaxID=46172 RepID=UPI0033F5D7A4